MGWTTARGLPPLLLLLPPRESTLSSSKSKGLSTEPSVECRRARVDGMISPNSPSSSSVLLLGSSPKFEKDSAGGEGDGEDWGLMWL